MRTIVTAVLLSLCALVRADRVYATVQWPGWTIETTDMIPHEEASKYPIENMIDGDPRTAWVYSKPVRYEGESLYTYKVAGSAYAILLKPDKPVQLDGIRLMNGYNKSDAIFKRNNRIVKLDIYENDYLSDHKATKIKTVTLSDRMGWHNISLPARKYRGLVLLVRGQVEGRDRDTCVSEVQLVSKGKAVDWNRPAAYLKNNGDECGCGSTWSVVSRGKVLAETRAMNWPSVSPDGRFAAGIGADDRVWVVDLHGAKVVRRWKVKKEDANDKLGWADSHTLGFLDYKTDKVIPRFKLK